VFPAVQRLGGQGGAMIATLLGQHARGREITAFVRAKCAAGRVGTADAEPLARALESFARMYEAHTAFEDTVIFQAWRDSLSEGRRREMGERFEQIEHDTFKTDGFEAAVRQVTDIEHRLGLGGPGRYTAPAP
jgi:hemerythrin-like domain-containing protein